MCSLIFGIRPVLDPDPMRIPRMIMGRNVAGGIDVRIGAAQCRVDGNPAIGQLDLADAAAAVSASEGARRLERCSARRQPRSGPSQPAPMRDL